MIAPLLLAVLALPLVAQQAQSVLTLSVAPVCAITDVQHQLAGVTTFRYYLRTGRQGGAELSVRFLGQPQQTFQVQTALAGPGAPAAIAALPAGQSATAAVFGPNQHTLHAGAAAEIRWSSNSMSGSSSARPELTFSCR